MKLLIHILAVAAFALPLNVLVAAEKKTAAETGKHKDHQSGHGECCDKKDCCKECGDHKDGKHSCCNDKAKAKECCKKCDDDNCKKACKSGHCKKGHCESKTPPPT